MMSHFFLKPKKTLFTFFFLLDLEDRENLTPVLPQPKHLGLEKAVEVVCFADAAIADHVVDEDDGDDVGLHYRSFQKQLLVERLYEVP